MSERPSRLVLLGHPVSHSLSPVFQNAALEAAHIHLRYEAIEVPPGVLHNTLDDAKTDRWAGNVTVPYKEAVFARCSEVSDIAKRTGAVNTFRASPRGIVGHNTDVDGFRDAIDRLLGHRPVGLTFGVIGAGGSAAAILAAIELWHGCRALVVNRNPDRLANLVARFSSIAQPSDVGEIARVADVVVNATSLGLRANDPLAIDVDSLRGDAAVLDLVYSAKGTRLVQAAQSRGLRADDGLSMLVGQGAAAFEWWFGMAPDREVMWRSLGRAPSASSGRR